ncbi:unnamed protein product [Peronospora destructor]|uniref:Phosphatidate cytidylyltransferase n=1 Tax=Peronospora destructor TaxID=86335 RepID=A0AAV0SYG8_9STRA|nr:unnamed protein product [Peronospora destructor]
MPTTPSSPGSPSTFYYDTATVNIVVLAPPSPSEASISSPASSSDISLTSAKQWLQMNWIQRLLSALVLAPLITVFLWLSPVFATATFCAFKNSFCSYEYAWLQHRIYLRFMTKMNACEPHLMRRDAANDNDTARNQHNDDIRVSEIVNRSIRSESSSSRVDNISGNVTEAEFTNRGRTTSGEVVQSPPLTPRAATVSPQLEDVPQEQRSSHETNDAGNNFMHDASYSSSAVSRMADKHFHQNEWIAALVLSALTTVVTTTIFLVYVEHIPKLHGKQLYKLRWFYSIVTDFVAALCAFFTPNWRHALVCLVEKAVFTLLTMQSATCPINHLRCGLSLEPSQVFLSGAVIIVFFRLQTRSSGPATFLQIALDMLGYLYIVGTLSVSVAFIDDERIDAYRRVLIVLLYVVWASDTGAYLTGKLLDRLHYSHYNRLAPHLSKNKDYEGTLGAILFGVAAMFITSFLLSVPGSPGAKVGFSVVAVIVGRLGDLFESLLKRAAGVKDSGKLIPGHGGVLDRIDAMMFASLVFARYYDTAVT